ncbi:hypothetical protein NOR_07516 [Metarhizium rileyi]|uniref:Uncharacterized protein n=1 Tax=Metarhizium rileyi (strain RCEF 4871) TaxID=1649241 RepID=A0A166Y1Y5_METRR|nr:hypothetical protein NOR_07516 [Metarhizium rileyi RCEF 4871]
MAYVQKQHIELVLNYADPSLRYDVGMLRMTIPPQRMASSIRCGLHCKPQLPRPYTTIHHKIMTRVVQGRFLLHREIRWSNGGEDRPDAVLSMHMSRCIARGNGETASHLQFNWRDLFFDQNDYGLVLKCPYCMSECNVAGTHESGIFRLWQDLGGEEDTGGHQCFLDMVPDHDRARTEAGRISRLFGPA